MPRDARFIPLLSRRQCLRLLGVASGVLGFAAVPRAQNRPIPPPRYNRQSPTQDTITIRTVTGNYPFLADILYNPSTPASALKARPPLARDEAVMYVVDIVRPMSLSNGGVPFATDILFVAADGRIIEVEAEILANDPTLYTARIPVKAAVQTIAGTVRRLDIRPGDHVLHPLFGRTL